MMYTQKCPDKSARINIIWISFCLLFIVSCREYVPQADKQKIEAIKRAKVFYGKIQPKLSEKFSVPYTLEPQWKKSSYYELDSSVHIPLAFDGKTGNNLVLVSTPRENGVLRSQVIERRPSADFYKKAGRNGSYDEYIGYINFYDPEGKFVIGAVIEKGVFKQNSTFPIQQGVQ